MALAPGSKLNEYEIVAPIGAGGMGEVYRARDTKLGREVAIKVLPDGFADDAERLARFEREAKLLASLNHENIATLYGLGEAGSIRFLAMELVEGETLGERLARGPMALDEALGIFRQIATALEAAHERGVIHRDLKPANVKITEEGKVKVLDFGLAKGLVGESSGEVLSQSPTAAYSGGTMAGMILGTAPYMSPEQARGGNVDQRTDVWAFGCVLFEALTGSKPFYGDTVTDTLAAVVRAEPDWSALPETTPPAVRRLLRRALAKDRAHRLPHVGAARLEIDDAFDETAETTPIAAGSTGRGLSFALAALVVGAVGATLAVRAVTRTEPPSVVRLDISLDEPLELDAWQPDVVISPDGRHVVYGGPDGLEVRALDTFETRTLANLGNDVTAPFVSPDGEWIGFFADGALKKVAIDGGAPFIICPVGQRPLGASWGPDDTIVFAAGGRGLERVTALGEAVTIFDPDRDELLHRWPEFLPRGHAVLFEIDRRGSIESSSIAVVSLETGEVKELLTGGSFPRYSPSGHLVYAGENGLRAAGFDAERLELTGPPVPVVQNVLTKDSNSASVGLSRDGTFVHVRADARIADRRLVWVDREGREEPVSAEARPYRSVALSPDGSRVVSEIAESNTDVWVLDLVRETSTRLTFGPEAERFPTWSPDGERVVYAPLASKAADGTGDSEPIGHRGVPFDVLPNGAALVSVVRAGSGMDVEIVSPDGEETTVVSEPFSQWHPTLSPDGRHIAYGSDESGREEVYVRPFPEVASGKWQISTAGGRHPIWARNGRELFYRNGPAIMAVPITTEPSFAPGTPRLLFEGPYFQEMRRDFDVSLDGQRFIMIRAPQITPSQIHVVLNWHEELKRLVPTP